MFFSIFFFIYSRWAPNHPMLPPPLLYFGLNNMYTEVSERNSIIAILFLLTVGFLSYLSQCSIPSYILHFLTNKYPLLLYCLTISSHYSLLPLTPFYPSPSSSSSPLYCSVPRTIPIGNYLYHSRLYP